MIDNGIITDEWLKSVGFKWHQFDRQPDKHWVLWLGSAIPDRMVDHDDLGLELAPGAYDGPDRPTVWFCWLRSDTAGRYHRFIHVRHLRTQEEVRNLVQVLSGQEWNPENHYMGSVRQPKHMEAIRRDRGRLDRQLLRERAKWAEIEKDDTRGRALPEHMQAHADQMQQLGKTEKQL